MASSMLKKGRIVFSLLLILLPLMSYGKLDVYDILNENHKEVELDDCSIARFFTNSVKSHDPPVDFHTEHLCLEDIMIFGVYDGHKTPDTSKFVSHYLPSRICQELSKLPEEQIDEDPKNVIGSALREVFVDLDNEITALIDQVLRKAEVGDYPLSMLRSVAQIAMAKSSATISVIKKLHVVTASVGNTGAIIATDFTTYHHKTNEHTGWNGGEVDRVERDHPGEHETVAYRNRLLGHGDTFRAFGDVRYKLPQEKLEEVLKKIFENDDEYLPYTWIPRDSISPPYSTALPDIQYNKLKKGMKVMVLATDGMWKLVTTEELLDIVISPTNRDYELCVARRSQCGYPADPGCGYQDLSCPDTHWKFLDLNIASHVIRNVFYKYVREQKHYDQALFNFLQPMPEGRSLIHRDDITVTVIMLNDSRDYLNDNRINDHERHHFLQPDMEVKPIDFSEALEYIRHAKHE